MIATFGNNIKSAFTGGVPVKAIYTKGVKVWPIVKKYKWVKKQWLTTTDHFYGCDIWWVDRIDGGINVYLNSNGDRDGGSMEMNGAGFWVGKKWNVDIVFGRNVWKDLDGNVFYSDNNNQYQLVDGEWVDKVWEGEFKPDDGENIFYANNIVYYSKGEKHYKLIDGVWMDGPFYPYGDLTGDGNGVWHNDKGDTFYTDPWQQKKLVDGKWVDNILEGGFIWGEYIWTFDGVTFYDYGNVHKKLSNDVWVDNEWEGDLIPRYADNIWVLDRHGERHIYYSYGGNQYELVEA